jgi:hypothetical protein
MSGRNTKFEQGAKDIALILDRVERRVASMAMQPQTLTTRLHPFAAPHCFVKNVGSGPRLRLSGGFCTPGIPRLAADRLDYPP